MIIYIPYGVGNAEGFPADYPRESKRVDDKAEVPEGWIKITEDEYTRLVQSSYAEVALINANKEESARLTEREKIQTVRQLFADCDTIDNDWANATNAQKFELARKTFKLLRRIKSVVIENMRDE